MDTCFAADRTLGRLTKWLRLLGFDTVYQAACPDEQFLRSLESERILLTRIRKMTRLTADRKTVFVNSNLLWEQLEQVCREFKITAKNVQPFSRCLRCNRLIVKIEKQAVSGRVPDYIFENHDNFHRCPQCGRVYWAGSHTRQSLKKIQQYLV
jgi:hypothetical protein